MTPLDHAAQTGDLVTLAHLAPRARALDLELAYYWAVSGDRLMVLQYLDRRGVQTDPRVLEALWLAAVRRGSLPTVEYLVDMQGVDHTLQEEIALRIARRSGACPLFQYLLRLGASPSMLEECQQQVPDLYLYLPSRAKSARSSAPFSP